jgi:hypothetical protein
MAESKNDSISLSGFDEPKPTTLRSKLQSMMRFGRPKYNKVSYISEPLRTLDRYDPTYVENKKSKDQPRKNSYVNYKFKDKSSTGDTIAWLVTNAKVISSDPCFEYEHYDTDGNPDNLKGPGGKYNMRSDDCVGKFWDETSSVIRVPYDVTIVNENMGERTSDAIKRAMFGSGKGSSRSTRKYKKKRSRNTKKKRGSRSRIATCKRK